MNVKKLQTTLNGVGYSVGPVDGDMGPKTYSGLLSYTAKRQLGSLGILLGRAMASDFPKYNIVKPLRIIHFISQTAHETGGFKFLSELGSGDKNGDGYDDYLQKYDYRTDLGNLKLGDGDVFRGRGLIHLTGRTNYKKYGSKIGIDLLSKPHMAAEPEIAVLIACLFWNEKKLNTFADADDLRAITKRINGGYNGIEDRRQYSLRLKNLFLS